MYIRRASIKFIYNNYIIALFFQIGNLWIKIANILVAAVKNYLLLISIVRGALKLVLIKEKYLYISLCIFYIILLCIKCHERQLLGLEWKAKVKGSLIRLFKAKEGSRGIRLLVYINILRLANLTQPSLIWNSAARASAEL